MITSANVEIFRVLMARKVTFLKTAGFRILSVMVSVIVSWVGVTGD
jgi:hypothetical protein